ncbi:YraN family protein [Breoghania sp. L-A4]|uniref:YraN family protein n=1 Tax=Breoghania sp. L-A4 TaxID=2304600 RepID=UPI000E35F95B|nr:YraN family protein [Breoghania sp. L-A4]AXS38939.1 YraN family protein [Breoghania sp. L-A4]
MTADPKRRRAHLWGLKAEARAALWLRLKGYRILARRYRTPRGEIDLVARRGGTVAIVEVKARDTRDAALEAITPANRRRVVEAANLWLSRNPRYNAATLRFDALLIAPGQWPHHMPNAFDADC